MILSLIFLKNLFYFNLIVFFYLKKYVDAEARKRCFPVPAPVVDPPPTPPACSKHEVYSDCGANGCQSTCANPTLNQVCKAMCIAGCICEEGYLRDSNGKCVLAKDCAQSKLKFLAADFIILRNYWIKNDFFLY